MANRTYSVKFKSEGLQALVSDLKQTAAVFDEVLAGSQKSVDSILKRRLVVTDTSDLAAFKSNEAQKVRTVQTTNEAIVKSYALAEGVGDRFLASSRQQFRLWIDTVTSGVKAGTNKVGSDLRNSTPRVVAFRSDQSVVPRVVVVNSPFKGNETLPPTTPDYTAKLDVRDRALVEVWRTEYRNFFVELKRELTEDLKNAIGKDDGFSITSLVSAPIKLAGDLIKFPFEATLLGAFSGFGETLTKDFSKGFGAKFEKGLGLSLKEVGNDVGDIVGQSVYRTYEASLKAVRNIILNQSGDKTPQVEELITDLKNILLGGLVQSASVPIKAHKRIQLNKKGLRSAMTEAGRLMIESTPTPEEVESINSKKSITLLVGGVNGDETADNTNYVNRLLSPVFKDTHTVPFKNEWSNSKITPEFKNVVVSFLRNILSNETLSGSLREYLKSTGFNDSLKGDQFEKLALEDPEKLSEQIIDFFEKSKLPFGRLLESAYQGYNSDDIMLAAKALYYKQNFPDKPLNIVGTSGGGFNAAGAIEILNRLGYKDVKGLGITTPFTGLEFTGNTDNFYASLGTRDPYYQMIFGSALKGLVEPPDFLQTIEGAGIGHLLAPYVGNDEFQNLFQYFFKDRIRIPPGVTPGTMNYFSRRVQYPEDENLKRTLRESLGEKSDPGYTYDADGLAFFTQDIKKKANKIQNKDIQKEAKVFIEFLEALGEEFKVISVLGDKFKPLKSLQKAAKIYPELKELATRYKSEESDDSLKKAALVQLEANEIFIKFKAKIKSEADNIKRTLQAMRGEKVDGYAFYDDGEYETRANDQLGGLIGHLENNLLKGATTGQQAKAYKYIDYLKRLQAQILERGKGGSVDPQLEVAGQNLFGFALVGAAIPPTKEQRRAKIPKSPKQIADEYNNYLASLTSATVEGFGSSSNDFPQVINAIKTQLKEYRKAIALAQLEVAKNLGENLLEIIGAVRQAATINGEVSPQTLGTLSRYQNEILKGDKGKGRANIGLTQLAQSNPDFQALLLQSKEVGTNVAKGLTSGIDQNLASTKKAGEQLGSEVIKGAEGELEIKSPSRVFVRIGKFIVEGLRKGISEGQNKRKWLDSLFDIQGVNSTVDEAFGGFFEQFGAIFSGLEEQFPIIGRFKGVIADLAVNFLALFGVFSGGMALIQIGQAALDTARRFEQLDRVIIGASGSAEKGAANLKFVGTEAKRLSLDLEAAKSAYGQLLASAQGSALEGEPINQIFSAVGEAAVNKGLDKEGQSRAFLAVQQMISKGKVSAEELRQQLGEVLPGTLQTSARALGLTTQQLDKMLESGQLLATDFFPKFSAQLSAENATSVSGSANTAQASITRFNNALTEFQRSLGVGAQPVQKLGLNIFSGAIEALRDAALAASIGILSFFIPTLYNLVSAFLKSKFATEVLKISVDGLKDGFKNALPALREYLAQAVLVSIAIQTWTNVYQLSQDSFKDIAGYANDSAKGLQNLAQAYREASGAAKDFYPSKVKRDRDLISNAGIDFYGIKLNLDTMYRKPIDYIAEKFGGNFSTQGQREYNDFLANSGDLIDRTYQNIDESSNAKNVILDIQKIDRDLEKVRSKRFDLLPGDRAGLEKSIEQEQTLLQEREKSLKITSTIQSNFARDAENLKKTLEAIDRLPSGSDTDEVRTRLETALLALEQSQTGFDGLVSSVSRGISELDRRMRNLNEGMVAFNENLEIKSATDRTNITNQGVETGRDSSKIQFDVQRVNQVNLGLKIAALEKAIAVARRNLQSPEQSQSIQNLDIDPLTIGSKQLERMLGEGRSPAEQSTLKAIQDLKGYRQQLDAAREQLSNGSLQLVSTLKEFTLNLANFYLQLQRQVEDLTTEASKAFEQLQQQFRATQIEIETTIESSELTTFKTSLSIPLLTQAERLLNGTNDAFEQYVNSLIGGLEKLFQKVTLETQLKTQLDQINNQITNLKTSQSDKVRALNRQNQDKQKEYEQLMRGSPNESFGTGTPPLQGSEILPLPPQPPPPVSPGSGNLPPPPPLVQPDSNGLNQGGPIETLNASWYGPGFAGNKTANGETFDPMGLTAAHKTLPFGTQLQVTNPKTGQGTTVRVNDRGPFIPGRDLDLSQGAARAIGLEQQGHGVVKVEIVNPQQNLTKESGVSADNSKQLPLNNAVADGVQQKLPDYTSFSIGTTQVATQQNIDLLEQKKSAITDLNEAQQLFTDLEDSLQKQTRQNTLAKYIQSQTFGLEQLNDQLADLDDKYSSDTPSKKHGTTIRTITAEYRSLGRQLDNQVDTLKQQKDRFKETADTLKLVVIPGLTSLQQQFQAGGDTKGASSVGVVIKQMNQEVQFLERQIPKIENLALQYQAQRDKLPAILKRAKQREYFRSFIESEEYENSKNQRLSDSNNSILESKSNLLQSRGDEFGSRRLAKTKAIEAENLRYQQQEFELTKELIENPTKYTAEQVAKLRQNIDELNKVNLANINAQFKDLGQAIVDTSKGALTQFFESVFTGTKSAGDAFRDMALTILRYIAQVAAQQIVLNIFGQANGKEDGFLGLFKKIAGHAEGGLVTGPGSDTSDSLIRRLSNGEFVVRAAAVRHWGTNFLEDLNSMRQPQIIYAANDLGRSGNSRSVSNPTMIVNVSTPDANSFRRSESQVGREAGELYRRSIARNS